HFILSKPHREVYDFRNTRLAHKRVPLGLGEYVRMAQYKKNIVRVVITATKGYRPIAYQPHLSTKEYHISLPKGSLSSVKKSKIKKKRKFYNPHKHELIVIDAGHGGHDTGAIGAGKREKDLVLQIAKRLARQLKKRGHPVYMTRKRDRFLKLPQRTKIADKKKAVVFISIHANSVPRSKRNRIHGIETFFLQNTRDAKSQRVAARENKSVLKGTTKLSRNVIIDSVLSGPKIVESNKLAIDVQRRMITNLRTKYSGVKDSG
ncbi:N-acetylmuramoyl-L-alanine amidase, partial [Sulfurovum lithotrophicum]